MDRQELIKFIEPIAEYRIGVMLGKDTMKHRANNVKRCLPTQLDDFGEEVEEPKDALEEVGNGYLVVSQWHIKQPELICGHESAMSHWRGPEGWRSWCQTCGRERWARLNKNATTLAQQAKT